MTATILPYPFPMQPIIHDTAACFAQAPQSVSLSLWGRITTIAVETLRSFGAYLTTPMGMTGLAIGGALAIAFFAIAYLNHRNAQEALFKQAPDDLFNQIQHPNLKSGWDELPFAQQNA